MRSKPKSAPKSPTASQLEALLSQSASGGEWDKVALVDRHIKVYLQGLSGSQKQSAEVLSLKSAHKKVIQDVRREMDKLNERIQQEKNQREGFLAYHKSEL